MNEIDEIWKPIIGYESRYIISNKGEIKSLKRNKVLKKELRRNYWSIQLYDGNKFKHFSIHRLVGIHFVENPNNLPFINHIDENKLNNNANNLEWCTASYNINYGTCIQRAVEKKSIPVMQLDKNKNLINIFSSISEAESKTKVHNPNIIKCCKGERKTAGGYIWKYANKN